MIRIQRMLAPPGSRRHRLAWVALVTIRKMREGPGPWFRAVGKGLFQLLPKPVRGALLRWSGEEQFHRSHEARVAGHDGGVERVGIVSVVLPVFNQASMLAESVASVLAQTHCELELIVVDDGSCDDVPKVMQRWLCDPRVRFLMQPNQGLPKALSSAFECATGEFYCWTSADNRMHPRQLEVLVAKLRSSQHVGLVWADYRLIGDDGAPMVDGEFRVLDRKDPRDPSVVRSAHDAENLNRYDDNFIGPCFLYRARIGRLLGEYNPELGLEDYDYWMRINRFFRIEHLGAEDVLYEYRVHRNTLSARARELKLLERSKALLEYERERATWVNGPLRTLADQANRGWLAALVDDPILLGDLPVSDDGWPAGKCLAVVGPDMLQSLACRRIPRNVAVVAMFTDVESTHRAAWALRVVRCLACGVDAEVAARLSIYRREAFVASAGPDAYALAVRFAANATFFRMTRDAATLRRVVPRPFVRRPLAVLLQLDSFGRGGLERVVLDLAAELLAAGHRVGLLVVNGGASGLRDVSGMPGLEIATIARRSDADYRRLLQDGSWDIVDAHASCFGAAVASSLGVPFVQNVHNAYVWYDRDAIEALRRADPHTAAYACVSSQALGYLDLRLRLDVTRAVVIDNGVVDAAAPTTKGREEARRVVRRAHSGPVFIVVASITPAKGHRAVVRAFASARRQLPGARLVLVGEPTHSILAAAIRGDVERLGVEGDVVHAGRVENVSAFLAESDVFVLPSYWEGCSLAVWEAVAAGLPLVLADVGAAAEQLRHGHGELVAPPYRSIFDVDATNVADLVEREDVGYVDRLAEAMVRVASLPRRSPKRLPQIARRATMARRKSLLFEWVRQGGLVSGVRALVARASEDDIA